MALVLRRAVLSNNLSLLRCMKGRPLATAFKINTPHTSSRLQKKSFVKKARISVEKLQYRKIAQMKQIKNVAGTESYRKARTQEILSPLEREDKYTIGLINYLASQSAIIETPRDLGGRSMELSKLKRYTSKLPHINFSEFLNERSIGEPVNELPCSCSNYFKPQLYSKNIAPHDTKQKVKLDGQPDARGTGPLDCMSIAMLTTTASKEQCSLRKPKCRPKCKPCECCCKTLPPPPPPGCSGVQASCMSTMTGYYYYPYGTWFCGPYHVGGLCESCNGPICPKSSPCKVPPVCATLSSMGVNKPFPATLASTATVGPTENKDKFETKSQTSPSNNPFGPPGPAGPIGPTRPYRPVAPVAPQQNSF